MLNYKNLNRRRKNIFRNILIFLAILGPGIITGSVDNDPGGITMYSLAGAIYGYRMLWTLIPAFIVLVVVQEMNARMGIVTGKGLADLIRENAGVKVTFFIFIALFLPILAILPLSLPELPEAHRYLISASTFRFPSLHSLSGGS